MALGAHSERLFLCQIWLVLLFRLTFATANEETPTELRQARRAGMNKTILGSEMSLRREAILLG